MTKDFFANITLSQEIASSYSLPNLIIGATNQLIQLNYDPKTQKYQPQATVDLWKQDSHPELKCNWVKVISDEIIVGTPTNHPAARGPQAKEKSQQKIIKLSRGLEKLKVREFVEIAAMAIDGEIIFLGTEGKLVTLDRNLEILGEVDLKLPNMFRGEKKNTHDILVHQSIAYLLDNVIEPTYVLRVDVSDPTHLQIISTFNITGINHHLRRQWLNPGLYGWFILQYYITQAGSGENIIIFPLDVETGSVDLSRYQFSGFRGRFPEECVMLGGYETIGHASFDKPENFQGTELITTTPLPPIWAVIHDDREQLYLALIDGKNQYKFFNRQLCLGELKDCHYLAEINPIDKLLFIVIKGLKNNNLFARLLIIDIAQKPSIIVNQDLAEIDLNSLSVAHCLN